MLHYAAFNGHRDVVRALVKAGADVNEIDSQSGATPAGWAIEYLRELGALPATELDDLAFAIRRGDADWVARFVERHPDLLDARDKSGKPF